jgi:hypothetical protein
MTPKFVTVSETIPLRRNTVEGLIDTIKEVFSSKEGFSKPSRIVYNKNEPLIVDRRVRQELAGEGVTVSAYQMVRQHTDIDIAEESDNPLRSLALASQGLSNRDVKIICLVVNNKSDAYSWFDKVLRPEKILNTKIIEDPECPENCIFVCGSKNGASIKDIEYTVLCRTE